MRPVLIRVVMGAVEMSAGSTEWGGGSSRLLASSRIECGREAPKNTSKGGGNGR